MYTKVILIVALLCPATRAGLALQEAEEAVRFIARKFGVQLAAESAEQIAALAAKCGANETLECFRKLRLAESAGADAPQAVKLLSRYGRRAIPLLSDARRLHLASLGEESVQAMLKHRGIAEDVIEKFGLRSARALNSLDGQGARRLAMLAQNGTLERIPMAQREALFDVILKRGDAAMNWIWRNKGALTVGTTLAAFLSKPDAFLQNPVAEGAGSAVKSVGVSFGTVVGAALALAAVVWFLRRKGNRYETTKQKVRGKPYASARD